MTTLQTRKARLAETPAEEHDRLRAQREKIARTFGHKTSGLHRTTVSPDCEGHSVPLTKRVNS